MARQFRSDDTDPWTDGYGTGADGAKTITGSETYDGANAGFSGTQPSGSTTVTIDTPSTFQNGDLVLIHQTRGSGANGPPDPSGINWELNRIVSGGGTTTLTLARPLTRTYHDNGAEEAAQIVEMKQYTTVNMNPGTNWFAPGWDQNKGGFLAFFASVSVNSNGGNFRLDGGSNIGYHGGPDPGSGQTTGFRGEGYPARNNVKTTAANGNGGSGGDAVGGGGVGGAGGGNGSGGEGRGGGGGLSNGGTTAGNNGLTIFSWGGAGGSGGTNNNGGNRGDGQGGRGAGGLLIFSPDIHLENSGGINLNGQNGFNTANGNAGGGGGGAAGSALFKGVTVNIGSNKFLAQGGVGGGGGALGGSGGVGRIHVDYATSVTGTSNPGADTRQDATLFPPAKAGFFEELV